MRAFLGVDIGTSSTKGILTDETGRVIRTAVRPHVVSRPRSGHVEMSGDQWWEEFVGITEELTAPGTEPIDIAAVGISGMGPCVLLTDAAGQPLRPAILYGVDTRATREIRDQTERLGERAIRERCGSTLSTQSVGPKLEWLRNHEPEVVAQSSMIFMPASWLGWRLTGRYYLDHHSASQSTPLFEPESLSWYRPWTELICPWLTLPELLWPGEVVGVVRRPIGGLQAGVPVIAGTIDAWMEAISAGAHEPGDLMLMYGTTMFLVHTVEKPLAVESLWATVGAMEGTRSLAGGMATSGAVTAWLRELFGSPDFETLLAEAEISGPGARGLLLLPYFAGERTPIMDPDARGHLAGLTLSHTRGDLYRSALEATGFGVRHNVETMIAAGAAINRVVAVGGGAKGPLWTQIVSDVTGLRQEIPSTTIGAAFGGSFLAASAVSEIPLSIREWNPTAGAREPDPSRSDLYGELYRSYRELYSATKSLTHSLVDLQRSSS